jgi:hypothetical protein
MINVNSRLSTNGRGYWSNKAKTVTVTGLDLAYVNEEGDFGELRVYFDTDAWDVDTDGLIYTDKQFISDLKTLLARLELGTDVSYSEQGMQGDNYVSLDVGSDFINSFKLVLQ